MSSRAKPAVAGESRDHASDLILSLGGEGLQACIAAMIANGFSRGGNRLRPRMDLPQTDLGSMRADRWQGRNRHRSYRTSSLLALPHCAPGGLRDRAAGAADRS